MPRGAGIATELRQLADKVVVLSHEDVRDQRAAEEDHEEIDPRAFSNQPSNGTANSTPPDSAARLRLTDGTVTTRAGLDRHFRVVCASAATLKRRVTLPRRLL